MGGGGMVVPLFFFCLLVSSTTAQDETVSFSIAVNHTGREFRQFIVDVRARLRVPDRPFVMQDAGRLPAQEDVPTRFMNLELRTEDHGITLRMRMDNLYVLGFLNGIGGGTWYEFNGSNLITGSTTLGFGPEYRGVNANLPLGRPHVEVAIDQLAAHGNDGVILDNDSLRSHLRTLIVHFVESMRITDVSELVARRLAAVDEADSDPVGNLGDPYNLIQNWGTLSTLLYVAANDAVQDPLVLAQRFQEFAMNGIRHATDAARALGLALLQNHYDGGGRKPRSVEDNEDHVPVGLRLVQVIDVIVRRIDDEDPGDLFGSITIQDGIGSQQLFYRDSSHTQSVRPGGQAQLTGPDRGMSAADPFDVNLDLVDEDTLLSPNDNVSNGVVVWNSLLATSDQFDVIQSRIIDGANGQVELRFAVMTDAVLATVEVVILESSEDAPNVYGIINAMPVLNDGTPVEMDLLVLTDVQSVEVARGSAVPLQRKVVAVPMGSTLRVGAFLSDRNLVYDDEHLARGYFMFETPSLTGEDSGEIQGDKGRVKVQVTWSSWFT